MIGILLANLVPAVFLAGIAWYLQVAQLPLLRDAGDFSGYIEAHRLRNTLLMLPPMAVEIGAAALLWWTSKDVVSLVLLALAGAILLITFLGIVPGFDRLTGGYDAAVVKRLLICNGFRTVGWTARSVILLWIVARSIRI